MYKFSTLTKLSILYFIVIFSACTDPEDGPFHTISFSQKAGLPVSGRSSAISFALNGKGYIGLGRGFYPNTLLNDIWEYNPENNSWTYFDTYPGQKRVNAIAAVINTKVYIGLGFNGSAIAESNFFRDFWSFNPTNKEWTALAGFPGEGTNKCVSFVFEENIYVGTGYRRLSMTREWWKYDVKSNTWFGLENVTLPGIRFGAVAMSNGARSFFGTGFNATSIKDWWEYIPSEDSWRQRASLPGKGRENAVPVTVENRLFVATGRNFNGTNNGGGVLNDIYEYEVKKNRWHKRGTIPGGGRENAISFVIDNKAYIGFGENDSTVLNDMWCFEP